MDEVDKIIMIGELSMWATDAGYCAVCGARWTAERIVYRHALLVSHDPRRLVCTECAQRHGIFWLRVDLGLEQHPKMPIIPLGTEVALIQKGNPGSVKARVLGVRWCGRARQFMLKLDHPVNLDRWDEPVDEVALGWMLPNNDEACS